MLLLVYFLITIILRMFSFYWKITRFNNVLGYSVLWDRTRAKSCSYFLKENTVRVLPLFVRNLNKETTKLFSEKRLYECYSILSEKSMCYLLITAFCQKKGWTSCTLQKNFSVNLRSSKVQFDLFKQYIAENSFFHFLWVTVFCQKTAE